MVNGARLSLAAFPRLQKIAPRSTTQTSRLRELAARVNAALPDDSNTSESVREEWVWSLPMPTRSITTKAIGFLAMAHASTPEVWSDVVAALGADGRFQVGYMRQSNGACYESAVLLQRQGRDRAALMRRSHRSWRGATSRRTSPTPTSPIA